MTTRSYPVTATPKGALLSRYLRCLAIGGGANGKAIEAAKEYPDTPGVELTLRKVLEESMVSKAAVSAGDTTSSGWAEPLSRFGVAQELLSFLDGTSILGRLIPSMRQAPFRTPMPVETSGFASSWVGEAGPKPISRLTLAATNLCY